jgi:hypothetical protein
VSFSVVEKPVTLNSLGAELATKYIYEHKRSSLALLLKNLGFSYKKDDNRRALMEKPHVVALRKFFLSKFMKNAESSERKPCVFLDETWVFANGTVRRSWQDEDVRSVKKISGEGGKCQLWFYFTVSTIISERYIVLHAGNKDEFIEDASLIFKSKKNSLDYHSEMNAETFEQWLQDVLLIKLQQPSVIVLDNASYHSRLEEKRPTSAWRKAVGCKKITFHILTLLKKTIFSHCVNNILKGPCMP